MSVILCFLPLFVACDVGQTVTDLPSPSLQSLLWFCNAIAKWNNPSQELNVMFHQLLQGFKQHDAAGWAAQMATFPPVIQDKLRNRYGV